MFERHGRLFMMLRHGAEAFRITMLSSSQQFHPLKYETNCLFSGVKGNGCYLRAFFRPMRPKFAGCHVKDNLPCDARLLCKALR